MKKHSIYLPLAVVAVALTFFGLGFFFGYKTKASSTNTEVNLATNSATFSVATSSEISSSITPNTPITNNGEVFWIKVGTNPVCPETHPIKGKFDTSTAKFYYTTDNKSYDRVRPDICFTTENFAKDIAGFIKKF